MAWYGVAPSLAVFAVSGGIPQQLRRRHTGCIDTDEQFATPRVGPSCVFFEEYRSICRIRQAQYSHFSPLSIVAIVAAKVPM
jgi:hypothetical protein